jgi:hypothetical protein
VSERFRQLRVQPGLFCVETKPAVMRRAAFGNALYSAIVLAVGISQIAGVVPARANKTGWALITEALGRAQTSAGVSVLE